MILELLADGSIALTTVCLLRAHLTPDNHQAVLEAARHKSKRDVEHLVAHLRPQPAAPCSVRKLPIARPSEVARAEPASGPLDKEGSASAASCITQPPKRRAVVSPLAPERYKVQLTVSRETYEKLRQAQDLLRHTIPSGDPAAIFDRALTALLQDLTRTKLATTQRPRRGRPSAPGSRHIPAAVKRQVWTRDGGRCAFIGTNGRCTETGFLEFHHIVPYAVGGKAVVENVELRCRAHNAYEAQRYFGPSLLVREGAGPMYWKVEYSVRTEDARERRSRLST